MYFRDLVRDLTMPLSVALDGGSGNGGSYKPQILSDLVQHRLTIQWSSVPGKTYDVQYKDAVSGGWSNLFTAVLAEGMTKSVVDNSEPRPAQRFYRVVFAP